MDELLKSNISKFFPTKNKTKVCCGVVIYLSLLRQEEHIPICLYLHTYVVCTCLCHSMPTSACLLYFLLFVLDEKILWSESRIVTTKLELVYLIEGSDFNAIQNHIIISFRSSILVMITICSIYTTKVICIWEQ